MDKSADFAARNKSDVRRAELAYVAATQLAKEVAKPMDGTKNSATYEASAEAGS